MSLMCIDLYETDGLLLFRSKSIIFQTIDLERVIEKLKIFSTFIWISTGNYDLSNTNILFYADFGFGPIWKTVKASSLR